MMRCRETGRDVCRSVEEMGIWTNPVEMTEIDPPEMNQSGEYLWQRTKNGCELLAVGSDAEQLMLPEEIEGRRLTVIGPGALRNRADLLEVTLPTGLRRIGDYAFYQDMRLRKMHIPKGTRCIGAHAFAGCAGLEEIYIPPTVTQIGTQAFPADTGLLIRGRMDSAAHRYAEENGIFFIAASISAA